MRHLIAYSDILTPAVAQLFLDHVWKLQGLPKTIISNKDSQFISVFWKELITQLCIKVLLSTVYYLETDGQIERVNTIIEQYIWIYMLYL